MMRCASRRAVFCAIVTACAAVSAFVIPAASAATETELPAGVQLTPQGVLLSLGTGGTERIQVCGDRILRVSYVASGNLSDRQSLTVTARWPAHPDFTVQASGSGVVVATREVQAHVDMGNGRVSYTDADGSALTSELAKTFGPSPSAAPGARQQVDTTFSSPPGEGLFGLGQHQDGVMDEKGHEVTLDQFNNGGVGGEVALPVVVSSRGYGLMWDTYSRAHFYGDADANSAFRFSAESDDMVDYYFMFGPGIDRVVSDYRTATGQAPLFPLWAYGLFQSKDHYASQAEVESVADAYRANHIPLDAVVQDWQYWVPSPWGSHVMDPARYPDPKAMLDHLHAENVHGMISVWGKFDPGSANYDQLNAAGCFYRDVRNGQTYGNYYDAYSPGCRSIYWQQIQRELFDNYGWDAFWLDASEWECPPGCRAYVTTALGPGVDYYNAYPLEHTTGLYQGQRADPDNSKRVFTLTRSGYAGQQRNAAATWSGDTSSSFSEFAHQITGGLNFSVSGIPYWTEDIGGYFPNGNWGTPANNELFTRRFEKGAFDPVFRIHGQGARELYGSQWSAQTKAALQETDELRYRLMPYIYSLAGRATRDGYTIMRPLVMDFQNDPNVYPITDEYMFGPSLLVAPVTTAGAATRQVYLPRGLWYDFWTGRPVQGGQMITAAAPYDHIPVYVRAGSVIPMGPKDAQYAAQAVNPAEIRVYPGADGRFTLYSDAGDGYGYEQGAFERIPLSYRATSSTLKIGLEQGSYPGMPATRPLRVVSVHPGHGAGLEETPGAPSVSYRGNAVAVRSPYAGAAVGESISVPAQPVTAGSPLTVTTDMVNAGPRAVRDISLGLAIPAGWTARANSPTTLPALGAGQSTRVSWTVTPSAPADPIGTAELTGQATYTAPDGTTGTASSAAGTVTTTSPVQPPYRAAASTTAYFGQAGNRFTIDADGADIFYNGGTAYDDDYGAIFLPGGAGQDSTATVRVDAQQDTDPWAKAGLVMRNDLTQSHRSAGYVALVATPGNGVSLQWDANGDGVLDSYVKTGAGTVRAPVWLKLTRAGMSFTGYYSTDGVTWTPAGSATMASAATAQDAGMIATAHNAGTLGRDDFSGFTVNSPGAAG